ncbi:hypothetical protein AZE42_06941, partial [Rhizopogon vesiculosus]
MFKLLSTFRQTK